MKHIGAIILAAGRGKRMKLDAQNKVTMHLAHKPIILHIVEFMKKIGIEKIIVVVGFAKETVKEVLKNESIIYAEQAELLGTGHAVEVALEKIPKEITDVFVVYGDDAVFYNPRHIVVMEQLFAKHFNSYAVCSFLTIDQNNPLGLGRIVRDKEDHLLSIVEEKDATGEQRKITEINPGCFVFSVSFLRKYLPQLEKSPITGEYYLTSLIDIALKNGEMVETLKGGNLPWRGVNTKEELQEAEHLLSQP